MKPQYLALLSTMALPDVPYGNMVLVAMAAIGFLLLKRTVDRVMEKVDIIPEKEWFEEVRETLKKIPDPTRLHEFYTQGNNNASTLALHTGQIAELQRRVGVLEERE